MISMSTPAPRALVTGAASGLGRAVAARLSGAGWTVAGVDLGPCPDLPHCAEADVSHPAAVDRAVNDLVARLGGLDAVAHCAGVFRNTLTPVHLLSDEDWEHTLRVNLTGSFLVGRACLPHLRRGGGALVLTSSVAGAFPQPGGVAYSASKAGVAALSRSIALEYAADGIVCNAVAPGYMRTAMTAKLFARDDLRSELEGAVPVGRIAEPEEVADIVAFLMTPAARYLTGEVITVDGGAGLTAFVGASDVDRMWSRHR